MRKFLLSAFVICLFGFDSIAQQDPQFTQFMSDRLSINPGVAGSKDAICATLLGRKQWNNFSGAPTTALLNIDGPISSIKSGIGLSVFIDNLGQMNYTQARLSYAYHLKVTGATKLGMGLSLGLISSTIDPAWRAYDYADGDLVGTIGSGLGDPSIPQTGESSSLFDLALGFYLHNPKYYIGLSSTHLSEGDLENVKISMARHYYLMGGYDFELSSVFNLQPNVLAKTDGSSTQVDVNANVVYDDALWAGITYRLEDAIAPQVGYQYVSPDGKSTLRIGYSYDITTSNIKNYNDGSHEIMLNYCLKIEKPLPKRLYKNVRFL